MVDLHKSIWTNKNSRMKTSKVQSLQENSFTERHIWQKLWSLKRMGSLLKDHREEESAVSKIGLCLECEEWICCCFGDHHSVVSAARPHRRPPDEQMESQEEKAKEVVHNVDSLWSWSSDKEQQKNGYLKPVQHTAKTALSVCLSVCLHCWMPVNFSTDVCSRFSSAWKEKEEKPTEEHNWKTGDGGYDSKHILNDFLGIRVTLSGLEQITVQGNSFGYKG